MFSFGLFIAINAGSEPQWNQEVQTLTRYGGDDGTRPLVAPASLFLVYSPDVLVQKPKQTFLRLNLLQLSCSVNVPLLF